MTDRVVDERSREEHVVDERSREEHVVDERSREEHVVVRSPSSSRIGASRSWRCPLTPWRHRPAPPTI